MRAKDELIMKSATLAQVAHQDWKAFLVAFHDYANEKMGECIIAPVEQLQVAQGRAQFGAELDGLFKDAVASASRIAKRAEPKQQ